MQKKEGPKMPRKMRFYVQLLDLIKPEKPRIPLCGGEKGNIEEMGPIERRSPPGGGRIGWIRGRRWLLFYPGPGKNNVW